MHHGVTTLESNGKTKGLTPPYVPYKTLETYLEELRQSGLPAHIDRSTMQSKSGGTQGQLLAALRSLHLIEGDEGSITPLLDELVNTDGVNRQQVWRKIINGAYPFLFNDDDFDLSTTTELRLRKKFEELGIAGSTVQRCVVFFIQAANIAGIELSSFVKNLAKRKRSTNGKSKQNKTRKSSNGQTVQDAEQQQEVAVAKAVKIEPRQPTLREKMLDKMTDKFPAYDPNWDPEVQAQWFNAFTRFNEQIMELDSSEE